MVQWVGQQNRLMCSTWFFPSCASAVQNHICEECWVTKNLEEPQKYIHMHAYDELSYTKQSTVIHVHVYSHWDKSIQCYHFMLSCPSRKNRYPVLHKLRQWSGWFHLTILSLCQQVYWSSYIRKHRITEGKSFLITADSFLTISTHTYMLASMGIGTSNTTLYIYMYVHVNYSVHLHVYVECRYMYMYM